MSIVSNALATRRLGAESAALRLLRADNVPVIVAILREHLGAPGARLDSAQLHELVDADLEALRAHFALPNNAKAYCDDWRRLGFLVRRTSDAVRGETLELSPDAIVAIRMIDQLATPRASLTESRLLGLASAMRRLATDTDPDSARRVAALEADRNAIDEKIAQIRSGHDEVLDEHRATERIVDILQQAVDLPGDFARVRARFDELNRELRHSAFESDDAQRTVLDDIFRGVVHIETSDEGRTFAAFAGLVRDPERTAALESDIAAILERDFTSSLDVDSRRFLRAFTRTLKHASRDVQRMLTEFARGLRRYVQSQEFQRDRALRGALHDALLAGAAASRSVRPFSETNVTLELSSMRVSSVGDITPYDPSEFDTGQPLAEDDARTADLAALRELARASEIDFRELTDAVNALVDSRGPVSIGTVLRHHPASQGLASVVGLLSLAARDGVKYEHAERLVWNGSDGVERAALVPKFEFVERIGS